MKKFICNGCEKHHAVESESQPKYCLMTGVAVRYDWREVTPDTPTKLTAEELAKRGIEWPEEADGAVVHSDGHASFYRGEIRVLYPCSYKPDWHVNVPGGEFISAIPGKWDASDWQNSLIHRPEKKEALPDWCKVGALCYNAQFGYGTIFNPKNEAEIVVIDWMKSGNRGGALPNQLSEARVCPWDNDSLPKIPFPVKFKNNPDCFRTTVVSASCAGVWLGGASHAMGYKELMNECDQLDGTPCGVREHREGEGWVR